MRIRIRFPFESSFWISVSGCKLTILPDIQPANRIVIISGWLLIKCFAPTSVIVCKNLFCNAIWLSVSVLLRCLIVPMIRTICLKKCYHYNYKQNGIN